MNKFLTLVAICASYLATAQGYLHNETPTHTQVISSYQNLANRHGKAELFEMGTTDVGEKLRLFVISESGVTSMEDVEQQAGEKVVLFINNGIHPGESCGIDASLQFAADMLEKNEIPKNVLIAIIPVYNVGGMLNRGSFSRANQLGPAEHGFRGNAQNLDLNRDFIKADALNTFSFYSIFHFLKPHLFVDTHTSNGADYQYTMTLISTQKDKLNPVLSNYLNESLEPILYQKMEKAGWGMTPYVNVFGRTPESGMAAFLETPRYASGYTTLFNTIGFITETHMLKPYKDRVLSTLQFLNSLAETASNESEKIKDLKKQADAYDMSLSQMPIAWKLDSANHKSLNFKGYEHAFVASKVHAAKRLKYYNDKPKSFEVPYYDSYVAIEVANIPEYYIVPAAWREVVLRMQYNGVELSPLSRDTLLTVQSTYLKNPDFLTSPYEGHFLLKDVETKTVEQKRKFYKGDYVVYTNQVAKRYIVNTLEAKAVDAFLKWNFFDPIFQQKEWFSSYVFEDTAEELLKNDTALARDYKAWQQQNPEADAFTSLYFIYRQSEYYEKEHLRYPVAKSIK